MQSPQRFAATNDRGFIGWSTGNDDGRIAIMRVSNHAYWVIGSDDFVNDPFGTITDLDLYALNGQIHIYLVTAFASNRWVDPFADCRDHPLACSGYHHVVLDPVAGESEVLSRRTLPWQGAFRFAVTRDARRGYVAYSNRPTVTLINLGQGDLGVFQIDPVIPEVMGGLSPSEIWLPRAQ